ncbi:MAG: hypothetical protein AAF264_07865, partial [Pseudomonadota bacterium]
ADLRAILQRHYDWALAIDFDEAEAVARFWYVSEEKLEPRLGDRAREDGADREQPLGIAYLAQDLARCLEDRPSGEPIASILLAHPEHRLMVRRVQMIARHPYAEIRANLLAQDMTPVDLLRCKLAFFGADRFDPRSDRWLRINLFHGALFPDEIGAGGL